MKQKILVTILFVSICGLSPHGIQGQPQDSNMTRPNRPDADNDIRNFIAWKLVDYLRLTEDQSQKLFPLWSEFTRGRTKLHQERREIFKKIESSVEDTTVSTDNLMNLLNELIASENKEIYQRDEFRKRSRDILDDRQYMKLIIFENRLLEDFLRDFNKRGEMRNQ